ncbi:hypothetical protein M3Y99_01779000 [Aphelenchoides fujianensis]|nr:hypothetical protein M3Y99_01779000 [Aphelenchoides fujianensis]
MKFLQLPTTVFFMLLLFALIAVPLSAGPSCTPSTFCDLKCNPKDLCGPDPNCSCNCKPQNCQSINKEVYGQLKKKSGQHRALNANGRRTIER